MKNFEELNETELQSVLGGRDRIKVDVDGDGVYDVMYVYKNNGELVRIKEL